MLVPAGRGQAGALLRLGNAKELLILSGGTVNSPPSNPSAVRRVAGSCAITVVSITAPASGPPIMPLDRSPTRLGSAAQSEASLPV